MTGSAVTATPALRVRHWRNHVLVAADHPSPWRVRDRVDDVCRTELGHQLAAVAGLIDQTGGELVFIRRLALEWAIDASWHPEAIASTCAGALAREVLAEIAAPEDGNVVRFRGAGDYLASYVIARASPGHHSAWFHRTFDGWATLPPGAAIRSALCADSDLGLAALRALPARSLASVIAVLGDDDIDAIVGALAGGPSTATSLEGTLRAWLADPPALSFFDGRGLSLWLLARSRETVDASLLRSGVLVFRTLNAAARDANRALAEVLARARDDVSLAALCAAARADDTYLLQVLAKTIADDAGGIVDRPSTAFTRFGGGFLLLDDLAEVDWEAWCVKGVSTDDARSEAMLRLVTLGHCLLGERWDDLLRDPLWRDLFRIPPALEAASSTACLDASEGQLLADSVLSRFARRLPGFARSSHAYLRGSFLCMDASVTFEPHRIVVTLSRPPLDLVLRLAGQTSGNRQWRWLDERPFLLVSGE